MNEHALAQFEEHRAFLLALGTKITGRHAVAEDLVNEAYLRWAKLDHATIRNPRAMLATIVSRLAISQGTSARARHEVLFDPGILWEMSDGKDDCKEDLGDALTAALEIVMGRLNPNERAVFLLREVFEFDYDDIAATLGQTETNCRQILRRAREKLGAERPAPAMSSAEAELVLERFIFASQSGDMEPLLETVCEDAVLMRDAGDIGMEEPPPIIGRELLLEQMKRIWTRFAGMLMPVRRMGEKYELAEVRDANGILAGALIATLRDGKIHQLRQITCPTKVRFLSRILEVDQATI